MSDIDHHINNVDTATLLYNNPKLYISVHVQGCSPIDASALTCTIAEIYNYGCYRFLTIVISLNVWCKVIPQGHPRCLLIRKTTMDKDIQPRNEPPNEPYIASGLLVHESVYFQCGSFVLNNGIHYT